MDKISSLVSLIKLLIDLIRLLGLKRAHVAVSETYKSCVRNVADVGVPMSEPECRQYEEEKYRD